MVARLTLASDQSNDSSTSTESVSYQVLNTTTTTESGPSEAMRSSECADIESYSRV